MAVAVALELVMDTVDAEAGHGTGPRAALVVRVACYGMGALLLQPGRERRVELEPGTPTRG